MTSSRRWFIHYMGEEGGREGSDARLVLQGPQGPNEAKISYALKISFSASNNEAEYEALIANLKLAKDIGAEKIEIFLDSILVVQQLKDEYDAKDEVMIQYLKVIQSLVSNFFYWNINKIPKVEIAEVDRLSKYASIAIPSPDNVDERVFVKLLPLKSSDAKMTEVMLVETALQEDRPESSTLTINLMTPYFDYLKHGILP